VNLNFVVCRLRRECGLCCRKRAARQHFHLFVG
jgi:hypothetical protein